MRRPVVFLFLFFTFGIALEYYLALMSWHFLIAGAVFAAGLAFSRTRLACLFLLAALLGGVYLYAVEQQQDPLELREGKNAAVEGSIATGEGGVVTVEGRILTVRVKDESRYQLLITANRGGKRLVEGKGAMEDPAAYVGKRAVVKGRVELPDPGRNPGLFDYRLYLKTRGVRVILRSDASQIVLREEGESLFLSWTARLKYGFLNKLRQEMDRDAYGLMAGMLFGDCSGIQEDTYEAFQKNGVAHILSVSGIHVGIVYLFISRLLGGRKTRAFYLITALTLVFYAALSEFSPSVVRSVIMILIHIFSKLSYRRYDFLSCTAASAMGMLLFRPLYLFSAGFQLSYLAVFCLAAMLPWTERSIAAMEERRGGGLLTEGLRHLSPLLIIQIGMAPLTAYQFNYFSFVSLLLNIPVIAISSVILPLGIVLIPLSLPGGLPFGVIAQAAELLTDLVLWLNELFYFPGKGSVNVTSPPIWLLLLFYGLFFLLSSEYFRILRQRGRMKSMAACCSAVLILSLLLSVPAAKDARDAGLVFVDVGQGDCLHLRTPGGKNILIDGGGSLNYEVGKKTLLPYLLKNGVNSVDLALVTHLHTDHYLGIVQLAEQMEIKKLGVYEGNMLREEEILEDTGLEKEDMLYLNKGDRIPIEKDIWIDVLYPEAKSREEYETLLLKEEDENGSCLFMKISYHDFTVMMTGDIGFDGEKEILALYRDNPEILDVDVLKVGHHGSRYSTGDGFLEAVAPERAVFQVGKNNFGHPHPSVIEKCVEKGIIVYRNDFNGAIIFTEEEQRWHTKVLLQKNTHIKE